MRPLGRTGLTVSALALGTVKLGRREGVRYPRDFALPDRRAAAELLARARELGINLLDTAPAYGASEARLGRLLRGQRQHWLLCTKVGEEFEGGQSRFDFSPEHTARSVRRSLQRLGTDVLDIVLVHSDGDDLGIIQRRGTLEMLRTLQREGLVRAVGMSTKSVAGGLAALPHCDVLMVTYNERVREEAAVLDACAAAGSGVLVKKALDSGQLAQANPAHTAAALRFALAHPGVGSVVVGTLSPAHLAANVAAARESPG